MKEKLQELRKRLAEIDAIDSTVQLLYWDQSTYMPPGGASARARQLATLSQISHEKFIDPKIGSLLDDLRPYEETLSYDSDDASLIRVTRRHYERSVKVPPSFAAEFANHSAQCHDTWQKARPANDFSLVESLLAKTVELSRRYSDFFPGYEHIADPLIDLRDESMTVAVLRPLFENLRQQLVPLVDAITSRKPADDVFLRKTFAEDKQIAFGKDIAKCFGYDFNRGRLDKTAHPFMIKFALDDVRITTRVREDFLGDAMFSIMHEAGHALYEQGFSPDLESTPLADGASTGVHESSSRLWENIVGRSQGFWTHFYPKLQEEFPDQLKSVSLDNFYAAINKVERSLIRTDADEVTYNLHVIIRFGLELELLEGTLSVKDLPEAWHESYKKNLGIVSSTDADGVLQDIHWYHGTVGGSFQCYTIGNIIGSQFFQAALKAHPEINSEIEEGRFDTLHRWLTENVYRHGRKFTADEIVRQATGSSLSIEPYIEYLNKKYSELYCL